jgi:hypothetical protein
LLLANGIRVDVSRKYTGNNQDLLGGKGIHRVHDPAGPVVAGLGHDRRASELPGLVYLGIEDQKVMSARVPEPLATFTSRALVITEPPGPHLQSI